MITRPQPVEAQFPRLQQVRRPEWLTVPELIIRPAFVDVGPVPDASAEQARLAEQELAEALALAEAEGRARGEALGRAAFDQALERLAAIWKELENAGERLVLGVEDRIIDLGLLVASSILERELHSDREQLMDLVRRAIALVATDDEIEIRLSPADLELLGDVSAAGEMATRARLTWKPDPTVTAGCVVESRLARVDASLVTRLRNVAERLHTVERE